MSITLELPRPQSTCGHSFKKKMMQNLADFGKDALSQRETHSLRSEMTSCTSSSSTPSYMKSTKSHCKRREETKTQWENVSASDKKCQFLPDIHEYSTSSSRVSGKTMFEVGGLYTSNRARKAFDKEKFAPL